MYNHQEIETKWQKKWTEEGLYKTEESKDKPKYYILDMFPYPSGAGLHVGHPRGYIATDVIARYQMLKGFNVLHPMGWDAFGLPAENYALANKVHPKTATDANIVNYKRQLGLLGFTYDWNREINTTDPEYYKWTQWAFIKMFERGLVYESFEPINWCPTCLTGLANEDVEDGHCERCDTPVEKKPMRQWVIRITDYADRLLKDLDKLNDWEEPIKEMQRNWIGRSEGAEVAFAVIPAEAGIQAMDKTDKGLDSRLRGNDKTIKVFTTRPDTIFGATYMVVCPEHEIIQNLKAEIKNSKEVQDYIKKTKNKSDLERTDLNKDKTGVELKGIKAINPATNEAIPIFVADYVLSGYGTGAIMAVPAHDERDFEFASKYELPIKQVVASDLKEFNITAKTLQALRQIHEATQKEDIKFWLLGGMACAFYARTIYRAHDDLDIITKDEKSRIKFLQVLGELGYEKIGEKKLSDKLTNDIFKNQDGIEIDIGPYIGEWDIELSDLSDNEMELNGVKSLIISKKFVVSLKKKQLEERNKEKDRIDWEYLHGKVFSEYGQAVNSDFLDNLETVEVKEKIIAWLEKEKIGAKKVQYKLKDWVFSRQRYWGEPIPLIFCENCKKSREVSSFKSQVLSKGEELNPGWFVDNNLPLKLPEVEHYEPSGTGESPLATITDWVNTTCPKCGGKAKRETNTMPQWAGSSWYYLRYCDPHNNKELISKDKEQYWLGKTTYKNSKKDELVPRSLSEGGVDCYVGGAEHATRHLIYARFWHKFLFDIDVVSQDEPFAKLRHVGLILAEDNRKMSKRWNNVINPDEIVVSRGADSLRIYEMFMGPFGESIAWNTNGLLGARKFLDKIYNLKEKVNNCHCEESASSGRRGNPVMTSSDEIATPLLGARNDIKNLLHKTIKKVGDDIMEFKFNTAVSAMMILVNKMTECESIESADFKSFLLILAPFAPHLAEELWNEQKGSESIFKQSWPEFDPTIAQDRLINLVVQINGKLRDTIEVEAGLSDEEAKKLALASAKVIKWLDGKEPTKVICAKGKLVNIVV